MSFNLKAGDEVLVIAGKDKGKKGKVVQAFPKLNRVVVDGVNITKRHLKSRKGGEKGQAISFAMPIHASNVQPVGAGGKPVRHTKAVKN
ncbi:50S ribosomal protein L24 [Candidatus Uhrbacteria bacterium]|jgi:large subunit ribosomal protein L24|nr:50S ribosomal protein L24 [Candidatus Uhrbacteria bacterium]